MRFLLDTSVFLATLDGSERLNRRAREIFLAGDELHLSAASSWEIAVKYGLRKLHLPKPPAELIPEQLSKNSIHSLPISLAHTLAGAGLPNHHKDPFDRILIAQAIEEGMTLLTSDSEVTKYPVDIVWCGK